MAPLQNLVLHTRLAQALGNGHITFLFYLAFVPRPPDRSALPDFMMRAPWGGCEEHAQATLHPFPSQEERAVLSSKPGRETCHTEKGDIATVARLQREVRRELRSRSERGKSVSSSQQPQGLPMRHKTCGECSLRVARQIPQRAASCDAYRLAF